MSTTPTAIETSLPYPSVTKILGKPDAATLRVLKQQIYANAAAVTSNAGGGNHGHLGMVMPVADYNLMTGTAWADPVHPGGLPQAGNALTNAQITERNRQYLERIAIHKEFSALRNILKQQILAAVGEVYLLALKDDLLGFTNVTPRAMLNHLETNYGIVTPDQLVENKAKLEADWNPDDPIETLWDRIIKVQAFANAGNDPLTDATVVRSILAVLEKTGVFADAIRDWRKRPLNQWTIDNLKTDFNRANTERLRILTAASAGYHSANNATGTTCPECPNGANAATGQTSPHVLLGGGIKMYYCWTHGLGKNANHTSATCNNKAEGHKDDATADNMMGGNNKIMSGRRANRSTSNNE